VKHFFYFRNIKQKDYRSSGLVLSLQNSIFWGKKQDFDGRTFVPQEEAQDY
jgi:hypothetical protein